MKPFLLDKCLTLSLEGVNGSIGRLLAQAISESAHQSPDNNPSVSITVYNNPYELGEDEICFSPKGTKKAYCVNNGVYRVACFANDFEDASRIAVKAVEKYEADLKNKG